MECQQELLCAKDTRRLLLTFEAGAILKSLPHADVTKQSLKAYRQAYSLAQEA